MPEREKLSAFARKMQLKNLLYFCFEAKKI